MIGKLTGKISFIQQNVFFLDVNNVGYRVFVPLKTLVKNSQVGKNLSLFIHTHVREDALNLYGFETSEELFLFERLLSISGVGAKTALAIISSGKVDEIIDAVINADVEYFEAIPGIGKKSAQRIIVDLKSTLGDKKDIDLAEKHLPAFKETLEALRHFGFSKEEAYQAIRNVKDSKTMKSEELLKETLKLLGR